MRDLALAGLVAVVTVVVNLLFAFVLLASGSVMNENGRIGPQLASAFMLAAGFIGVSQLAWVAPAIVLARKQRWLAGGMAIGAALTLLLNGILAGGVYVLCANFEMHP